MKLTSKLLSGALVVAIATAAASQTMGKGGSEISGSAGPNGATNNGTPKLERCSVKLGTLAVHEPQGEIMKQLAQMSLPAPTQMIRLIVQQSGCFAVVERGVGMQNLMQERALSDSGQLRSNQNVGRGQMVTADFILTPDVLFKNNNAGGVGGALGGLFGPIGAIVGGSLKVKTAQVTLTMADTRSGLQVGASTGSSEAVDFALGGLFAGGGGGMGLGAYENTAEGKVVTVAFLDAYNKIVRTVQESPDLTRNNSTLNVAKAGSDAQANAAKGGELGRAKIGGIAVYASAERKGAPVFKLNKDEEMVILSENSGTLEIQAEKGNGYVDARMIAR